MLIVPDGSRWGWRYHNGGTNPSATPGTSVAPGINNAEGSWTQIAAAGSITAGVWGLWISVSGGNTSGQQKDHLLDIGIDEAGGTSYTTLISNIICGQSQAGSTGTNEFYFPINFPSGTSVAVRAQGNNATAGTVRVHAMFFGKPSHPESTLRGEVSETIGAITNSGGVAFTPGNAADGTWASLGTTTRNLWWWQLAVQVSNGTITAHYTWCDLAYGDASNKVIIIQALPIFYYGTAEIAAQPNAAHMLQGYCYVPAGSTLYVRGRCSTTPLSGYNAVAIGIG
jgi:hypothetical protein